MARHYGNASQRQKRPLNEVPSGFVLIIVHRLLSCLRPWKFRNQ
jgi:hypothetical protein